MLQVIKILEHLVLGEVQEITLMDLHLVRDQDLQMALPIYTWRVPVVAEHGDLLEVMVVTILHFHSGQLMPVVPVAPL
jgi:hypothetical protein